MSKKRTCELSKAKVHQRAVAAHVHACKLTKADLRHDAVPLDAGLIPFEGPTAPSVDRPPERHECASGQEA
eukprot:1159080-Pelagomonas_calceolata.AAC.5